MHPATSIKVKGNEELSINDGQLEFPIQSALPYVKEIYRTLKFSVSKAYSYTRKEHWTWNTNMAAMTSNLIF